MICMHGSIRVYTNVKLVLPNPPTFVGWGIREPGLILYTSHLLASFNLGRPPAKFNGRKSSLDVGVAGSGAIPFFIHRVYRGFGVSE